MSAGLADGRAVRAIESRPTSIGDRRCHRAGRARHADM